MAAASIVSPAPNATGSSQAPACQGHDGGLCMHMRVHTCARLAKRGWLKLEGCLPGQGQAGRREAGKQPELVWGHHPQGCRRTEPHPSGAGAAGVPSAQARRDRGWISPMQGRAGVEQLLPAALQGLTQGSPSAVPIRAPKLTQVPPRGYFGSWKEIKVTGAVPGELSLHGAGWIPAVGLRFSRSPWGGWPGTGGDSHPCSLPAGTWGHSGPRTLQTRVHPPGHCAWNKSPVVCPYGGH